MGCLHVLVGTLFFFLCGEARRFVFNLFSSLLMKRFSWLSLQNAWSWFSGSWAGGFKPSSRAWKGRGREARPLKGAVSSGFIDTIELSLRSRQNNLLSVCKGTAFRSLRPTGVNPKGGQNRNSFLIAPPQWLAPTNRFPRRADDVILPQQWR